MSGAPDPHLDEPPEALRARALAAGFRLTDDTFEGVARTYRAMQDAARLLLKETK